MNEQKSRELVLFIYLWVIGYLLLHQLIIPVLSSLLGSRPQWHEIAPEFALHIGLYLGIKKALPYWRSLFLSLLAWSLLRVAWEVWIMIGIKQKISWHNFSIFLTQGAILSFMFVLLFKYRDQVKLYFSQKDYFWGASLLTIFTVIFWVVQVMAGVPYARKLTAAF